MTCQNPACRDHAHFVFCPACWLQTAIGIIASQILTGLVIWALAKALH